MADPLAGWEPPKPTLRSKAAVVWITFVCWWKGHKLRGYRDYYTLEQTVVCDRCGEEF